MILQVAMLGTFAVPIWDGRAEVGKTEGRCVSSTSMFHCLVVFAPRGTEDITWFCFALLGHHLLQYAEAIGSLIGKSYGNPEIKMPTTGNSAHSVEDHKGEIPHKDVYSMCHRGIVNEEGGHIFRRVSFTRSMSRGSDAVVSRVPGMVQTPTPPQGGGQGQSPSWKSEEICSIEAIPNSAKFIVTHPIYMN